MTAVWSIAVNFAKLSKKASSNSFSSSERNNLKLFSSCVRFALFSLCGLSFAKTLKHFFHPATFTRKARWDFSCSRLVNDVCLQKAFSQRFFFYSLRLKNFTACVLWLSLWRRAVSFPVCKREWKWKETKHKQKRFFFSISMSWSKGKSVARESCKCK